MLAIDATVHPAGAVKVVPLEVVHGVSSASMLRALLFAMTGKRTGGPAGEPPRAMPAEP
jgi:hypothetical protein